MRRPIAIVSALVVLAGGVAAGCGGDDDDTAAPTAATTAAAAASTTATAPSGGMAAPTAAVRQLKVDLAAVVTDMRKRPYVRDEARLGALDERLRSISAGIAALEAHPGAPGASAAATANLRQAEDHLRQYIERGRAGEEVAMQLQMYRYLWALNRLPASLSDLYGA